MPRSSRSVSLALLGSAAFLAGLSCASPNGGSGFPRGPLASGSFPGGAFGSGGGLAGVREVVHNVSDRAMRGGFGSMVHAAGS